jgi:hypothetical protein
MSIREAEIAECLSHWLDRYAVPMHLRGKAEASQAEAECLARVLCKFAPAADYITFLNQVFDQVDFQARTRFWPTVAELGAACSNVRKGTKLLLERAVEPDLRPVAITARKMRRGEPVGEAYLWAKGAVELIAERLVDEATMRGYRIAAFNDRKAAYGEEAALRWEAEAKARHEDAKVLYRSRNDPRSQRRVVFPDKSAKPQSGAA